MQQVERRDVAKHGFSPVKGSLIVAVLALAGGAFLLLTTNDPKPTPPNTTNAPPPLTITEAIDTFAELNQLGIQSVQQSDKSLIDQAFAEGSPLAARANEEIDELERLGASDRSVLTTLNVEVLESNPSRIVILETNRLEPCFVSSDGRDITEGGKVTKQQIEWSMVREDRVWKLENAVVRNQQVIGQGTSECP